MTPLENRARNSSYFFAIIRIKGFHALRHIRIVKLHRCWRTCVLCSHCHALERRIEFLLFAVIQSHVNHKGFRLLFRVNSIRGSKSGITAYQWRHWRERGELLFPRVCQQPMFVLYSLLIILALLGSTEFQLRFSLVYVNGLLFQPTTFASLLLNI